MKVFRNLFLVVICSLMASVMAAVPVFKKSTAPENWDNTRKIWLQEAGNGSGEVPVGYLYAIAKVSVAKVAGHPSAQLTDREFSDEMARRNGLPAEGNVPVELVRRKAQDPGIFLPEPAGSAAAKVVAQATSTAAAAITPVSAPQGVGPVVAPTDTGITRALEVLNRKVGDLEKRGADTTALSSQMAALKAAQGKAVTNEQYQKLANEVAALLGAVATRLGALEKQVADPTSGLAAAHAKADLIAKVVKTVETDLAAANERLTVVESKVGTVGTSVWFAVVAAGALGLLALIVVFLRKPTESGLTREQVREVASGEAMTVARNFNLRIGEALETAHAAKKAVEEVRRDTGHKRVIFDGEFDRVIEALKTGSETEVWPCHLEAETGEYPLIFQSQGGGMVTIFGIEGQTNMVKVSNLKSVIGRAAQPYGDLPHRLVGATAEELQLMGKVGADTVPFDFPSESEVQASLDERIEPVFAETQPAPVAPTPVRRVARLSAVAVPAKVPASTEEGFAFPEKDALPAFLKA